MLLPRTGVQMPPCGALRVGVVLRLNAGFGQHQTTEAVHARPEGPPSHFHLLSVPFCVAGKPLVRSDTLLPAHQV